MANKAFQKIYTQLEAITKATVALRAQGLSNDELAVVNGRLAHHLDCGLLLYNEDKQDMHSGASGCGTSASVLASYFLPMLKRGEIHRILFLSTGAMMSPSSVLQGTTIKGIAPCVVIESQGAQTNTNQKSLLENSN